MSRQNKRLQGSIQSVLDQLGFGWYQVRVIVVTGIALSTDTMETLIQAILGPTLRCEWNLNADYIALLATMVFSGVCVGSPPMGYASDQLGRRSLSILCALLLTYMTWLCAIAPTYTWLALLRFISGLCISGLLAAGSSMISEFLPEAYQSTGQLLVCSFDCLVGLYVAAVGYGCLVAELSWRFFLLFTTLPLLICALGLVYLIHESPIMLAHHGNRLEAAHVLDVIARTNNRVPKMDPAEKRSSKETYSFVGRLRNTDAREKIKFSLAALRQILRLFLREYKIATPLLIGINFIWGIIMYGGTTLLPVELPSTPRTCLQSISRGVVEQLGNDDKARTQTSDCCLPLLKEGYMSLLSSVVGSVLSFPIALVLITCVGRKRAINICFLLTALTLFIEAFCLSPTTLRIIFFATRAVASAGNNATSIYLTGLYDPGIRSLGFGVMSTFFRVGVLTAPYLGQVFLQQVSALGAVLIFSALALVGLLLSVFLPHTHDAAQVSRITGKRVFQNVFKSRPPVTAEAATAAASGQVEMNKNSTRVAIIEMPDYSNNSISLGSTDHQVTYRPGSI